jgi:hypothetical protein
VLGDVGEPQLVGLLGGELALDEVVVHRRTGHPLPAPLDRVHRPQTLYRAQPVDAVAACVDAALSELVADEAVAEPRVVVVDIAGGVDQVGVVPVPLGDRIGAPLAY